MIDLLIVVVMIAIIVSLGFGLYYLVNDRGTTNRIVMSLSFRVALAMSRWPYCY